MAIAGEEEGNKAIEVENDFLRHRRGADADHGQRQVAGGPGRQGVGNVVWEAARNRLHLSGSEIREIAKLINSHPRGGVWKNPALMVESHFLHRS